MRTRHLPDTRRERNAVHAARALALALAAVVLVACPRTPPAPRDGVRPWEARAQVPLPGGTVNAAGGGLVLVRPLLEIDTRIGPVAVTATHHSASGAWFWSFEPRLVDGVFHDGSGASFEVAGLPDGAVVPGTDWVKLDATHVKTRGGLVHAFDGAGRLSAVHWSSDPYPRLRHVTGLVGSLVRTVAIEQCTEATSCEPVYTLLWDAEGRLVAVEDRAGRRAELDWDAAGRLVASRDGGDVEAGLPGDRYAWTGSRIATRTASDGEVSTFQYLDGRVTEVALQAPGTPTWRFSYVRLEADRNLTTWEDPTGVRTEIEWDDTRRVVRVAGLDAGTEERFAWDGLRETRHERSDGTVTERQFLGGRLVSETLPDGNVREYQWNPDGVHRLDPSAGTPTEVRDGLGVLFSARYDAAGRPLEFTDAAGDTTRLAWNGVELASVELPSGVVHAFEGYGAHGWPATLLLGGEIVEERLYDAVGNRLRGRDLDDPTASSTPGVVERHFDADRRVVELVLVELVDGSPYEIQRTLRVVRRADGRVARVERPYGGDTEYLYDARGLLAERRERVDGLWQSTTYGFDAAGRPLFEEKANGMRREWSYDAAGRPATMATLRGGVVETVATSTWQGSRLLAVHDSVQDASELYLYDAAGRVERVVHPGGESSEVSRDARGHVTSMAFRLPGGQPLRTIEVERDAAGREIRVLDEGTPVLERTFAAGRLQETRYGNGLVRTYAYEELSGIWSGAETTAADGSFVASTEASGGNLFYTVFNVIVRTADPGGLVPDPPPGSAPGEVRTAEHYTLYGNASEDLPHGPRLFSVTHDEPNVLAGHTLYDALSNATYRLLLDGIEGNREEMFVYNAEHNRLLERRESVAGVEVALHGYAYDEAGYVTDLDGTPIEWTGAGRIASVGGMASFTWDALGRPISRTVLGEETVYWFGGLMEAPPGATPAALDLGEVRLDLVAGQHLYRHPGPRQNVKFVTDAQGQVVAHHLYDGYGRVATYGPSDDARGFAGGLHAGGLVVLGARVLDPASGRFLSPDPVDPWLDTYAYAWGNPVHFWDPGGNEPEGAPSMPPAFTFRVNGYLWVFAGTIGMLTNPGWGLVLIGIGVASGIYGEIAGEGERNEGGSSAAGAGVAVPPVVGYPTTRFCYETDCIRFPFQFSGGLPSGGGPGPGLDGFGLDFSFASPGCSAPPGFCGLGPELVVLLPWLLRKRAARRRKLIFA